MSTAPSITSNNNDEKQDNKTICEALGCTDKSTEKIKVNAGKFGYIEISLCKKCKSYFDILLKNQCNQSSQGTNQLVSIIQGEA